MGDVILTSPIVRCIKNKFPDIQIHFLVKEKFIETVATNTYIHTVHTIKNHYNEVLQELKNIDFDFVIDLQKNRKSTQLRAKLNKPAATFPKLNFKKFLLTKLKINTLPKQHVVDRYFNAVQTLPVNNDNKGLDFFINENQIDVAIKNKLPQAYFVFVLGATYFTKRIPVTKCIAIIQLINFTVVLLGGPTELPIAEEILKSCSNTLNFCGKTNLQTSAYCIQQSVCVVTGDTGLMHIAAAFKKKIISIWGNTVPDFGMYPYMPENNEKSMIMQVENLKCRPCTKLGYQKCPKKHFKCMQLQDENKIALAVKQCF